MHSQPIDHDTQVSVAPSPLLAALPALPPSDPAAPAAGTVGVLHLINGEHYAGAERVQDLLAKCLPEFGYHAGFACVKPDVFAAMRQSQERAAVGRADANEVRSAGGRGRGPARPPARVSHPARPHVRGRRWWGGSPRPRPACRWCIMPTAPRRTIPCGGGTTPSTVSSNG